MQQPRSRQRGMAALAIALILLFGMTVIAFFANRGILFEQKTSANQYRATSAFEAAEAGLEWATALLNDPRHLDASCRPDAAGSSFRDRYLPTDAGLAYAPVAGVHPACRLPAGELVCSCPAPGGDPDPGVGDEPGFAVSFAVVDGDPASVLIVSTGCVGLVAPCLPGADAASADATATVRAILRARPSLRAVPPAALTAGGAVDLGTAVQLANTDAASHGILVDAGGALAGSPAGLETLPGTPPANALIQHDASLQALADGDASGAALFAALYGHGLAEFRAAPTTHTIQGASAAERGARLLEALEAGHRAFWVDGELSLAGGAPSLGSAERPLALFSNHEMRFDGNLTLHGLVHAGAQRWNAGGGSAELRGALVARGEHVDGGTTTLRYDAGLLARLRHGTAVLQRVPGSWRDL